MTETTHPPSFHRLCDEPDDVASDISSEMLAQAQQISPERTQAMAVVKALIAEAIYEHQPREGQPTYREATAGTDPIERELLVLVDVDTVAESIIQTLRLDADHENLICDSGGVTGVQLDGYVSIPFRCPDCA